MLSDLVWILVDLFWVAVLLAMVSAVGLVAALCIRGIVWCAQTPFTGGTP